MPKMGGDQDALSGHIQDRTADSSEISNTHLTSTQRGNMPEARVYQNTLSGEKQSNTADMSERTEFPTSSEDQVLTHNLQKAHAVLGYGDEDKVTQKKSPKSNREKKSLRNFFHRKGSKEPTTPPSSPSSSSSKTTGARIISAPTLIDASPNAKAQMNAARSLVFNPVGSPSSSGKTTGGRIISAPTLIDASPNAKAQLNSARSLVDNPVGNPVGAKNVVNYSRPITLRSSSDASNLSPVARGRSEPTFHDSNVFLGQSTSSKGLTDKSQNTTADSNTTIANASALNADQAADQHDAEEHGDGSDRDSFNPSDYSGDENSVQQAVGVPIVFRGKAKLVDIRPQRRNQPATPTHRPGLGTGIASGTLGLTDQEAEALGAQDADRYLANAMTTHDRPTNTTANDPFIDPAYRSLLAKPANEIAAKEMARLKAVREHRSMGGGLMERMNALLAKNDAKPEGESTGVAVVGPRTNKKETKKGKEPAEGREEVVSRVQADVERGLREERKIHEAIKAKMEGKAAALGGVYGAGIPRIDYGPPSLSTALGGNAPTDEERAHARALTARLAAGRRLQDTGDNTTARGQFEGC